MQPQVHTYCRRQVKREKSFAAFVDFRRNAKVFPMNLLSNGFLSIQMERDPQVFPTFE